MVPRILRLLIDFLKICAPLLQAALFIDKVHPSFELPVFEHTFLCSNFNFNFLLAYYVASGLPIKISPV
jgi:hypothetical protein